MLCRKGLRLSLRGRLWAEAISIFLSFPHVVSGNPDCFAALAMTEVVMFSTEQNQSAKSKIMPKEATFVKLIIGIPTSSGHRKIKNHQAKNYGGHGFPSEISMVPPCFSYF